MHLLLLSSLGLSSMLEADTYEFVNKTPFEVQLFVGYTSKECTGKNIHHKPIPPGKSITENSGNCTLDSVQGYWPHNQRNSTKLGSFKGNATYTFVGATPGTFQVIKTAAGTPLFAPADTSGVDLKLMTLNTYSFPVGRTEIVKGVTSGLAQLGIHDEVDLAANIKKPTLQRIDALAEFIIQKQPDVVVFQELWGDVNKKRMLTGLQRFYPFSYYNKGLVDLDPTKIDDGLLVVSKYPFFLQDDLVYKEKTSEEKYARKGALIVGIYNRNGNQFLLVNTHLQSGTGDSYVRIKEKQIAQLAEKLKAIIAGPKLSTGENKDISIIIAGDFNEPIVYQQGVAGSLYPERRFIDRTKYIVNIFKQADINVSNAQALKKLAAKYKPEQIIEINQIAQKHAVNDAQGNFKHELDTKLPQNHHIFGNFQGHKGAEWTYWPEATDPDGWQILDHILLDSKKQILAYQVFRKETLGDRGEKEPYNGEVALSDHAPVMVEIGTKK